MAYNLSGIIGNFQLNGDIIHVEPYGHGTVNDTYAAYFKFPSARPVRYILQRINHHIFHNPAALMHNISGVTSHITRKIELQGGDVTREVLRIVPTHGGTNFYIDPENNYWRVYHFIDDAASYQHTTEKLLRQSGIAFGRFLKLLADYPVHTLHENIPHFHNTKKWFDMLEEAVRTDALGHASQAEREIEFAMARRKEAAVLTNLLEDGDLPLRAVHNDARINNVMIDNTSGKAVCVIDLDTVMPGLSLYDFGNSIRLGAATGNTDESGPSQVSLDLELFREFTEGFLLHGCGSLTQSELELMPFGVKIITFEYGIRFLTDFLNGDTCFKTRRRGQNLDRCRTHFRLVEDIECKMDEMAKIVAGKNTPCARKIRTAECFN